MPFISPFDPNSFDHQVWDVVEKIPLGKVTTYGRIAEIIAPLVVEDPKRFLALGARWVGGSMSRCPEGYPWHRVVNSKGEISPRGGAIRQRELLESEGVVFQTNGKIDLNKHLWMINSN